MKEKKGINKKTTNIPVSNTTQTTKYLKSKFNNPRNFDIAITTLTAGVIIKTAGLF